MKAQLFDDLCNRLDSELNKGDVTKVHGRLEYISRFVDQFNNESKENGISKPAIALKISSTYLTQGKGHQSANVTVIVYLAYYNSGDFRMGEPRQKEALNAYCYLDEIHKVLQGWMGFRRVEDDEDPEYDVMITDTVTYQTTLIDKSADPRRDHVEALVDATATHDSTLE